MGGMVVFAALVLVGLAPAAAQEAQEPAATLDVTVVEDSPENLVLLVGAPELAELTIPDDAFEVRVDGDVRPSVARPLQGSELRVVVLIDNAGAETDDQNRALQLAAVDLLLRLPTGATAAVVSTDGRTTPPFAQLADAVGMVRELGTPDAEQADAVVRAVDLLVAEASPVPPTLVLLTSRPALVDELDRPSVRTDLGESRARVRPLVAEADDAEAFRADAEAVARELSSLHVIDVEPRSTPGESVEVLLRPEEDTTAVGTAGSPADEEDDNDMLPVAAGIASLSMAAVLWAIGSRPELGATHNALALGARFLLVATLTAFVAAVGVSVVGAFD